MWHLIVVLRWVLVVRMYTGRDSSMNLLMTAAFISHIHHLSIYGRSMILIRCRSCLSRSRHVSVFAHSKHRRISRAQSCWRCGIGRQVILNHGSTWRVQHLVSNILECPINRKASTLNLLSCWWLVHNHGWLHVLWRKWANPSRLINDVALARWLAHTVHWLLANDLWNLRVSVPSKLRLRHFSHVWSCVAGNTNLLWSTNVHALTSVCEIWWINVLVLIIQMYTRIIRVCRSSSTPNTFQHLLFLRDPRTNIIDNAVNSSEPLHTLRLRNAGAGPICFILLFLVGAN